MAYQAQKTKHSGAKKGKGAYWGRKVNAKKESSREQREEDKKVFWMSLIVLRKE